MASWPKLLKIFNTEPDFYNVIPFTSLQLNNFKESACVQGFRYIKTKSHIVIIYLKGKNMILYLPVLQTSCRVLGLENLFSSQQIQL